MKETKVYVDDETLMKCERYRHNSCPIIQTHDRELVKEVCEKIKELGLKHNIEDLNGVFISYKALQEIQKEYEK